jgi:hypothetical protein
MKGITLFYLTQDIRRYSVDWKLSLTMEYTPIHISVIVRSSLRLFD